MDRIVSLSLMLAMVLTTGTAAAEIYEVGPGKKYTAIGQVPWESLVAGDEVRIHWREAAYKEKWVIARHGTAEAPIVVRGVRGPGGERPVIDGRDATTRSQLNFWSENRGVIKIGGANVPSSDDASHIVIEGLDIRSGRAPYSFTGRNGVTPYRDNAAAIFVEAGRHITIRDSVLRDSGNGLFAANASANLLIEGNHIYDNGVEGSIYEHNNYTEANGIIFQFNHFGPLRAGCPGNNLKDRSAGTIVRYNWIESGNRQLDLVESGHYSGQSGYGDAFVYGNVLVEPDGAGNSQIVHFGGDSGSTGNYRKGKLHFFHNTVVSTRSGRTTLLRLSTNDQRADVRNNIVYVTAGVKQLALLDSSGRLDLGPNWISEGWVNAHGSLAGTVNILAPQLGGASPLFAGEYRIEADSPCRDSAGTLAADLPSEHAVLAEFGAMPTGNLRPADGKPDLGAFEYAVPAPPGSDAGPGDPWNPLVDGGPGDDPSGGGGGGSGGGADEEVKAGCVAATRPGAAPLALLLVLPLLLRGRRFRRR